MRSAPPPQQQGSTSSIVSSPPSSSSNTFITTLGASSLKLEQRRTESPPDLDEVDEVTVEDLLYDAQMEMIAHRHDRAISKLEQAVEKNSSSACATLANLYSKGYCRSEIQHQPSTSVSPPSAPSPAGASSISPPSTSTSSRPRMPNRSTSWNCHQNHAGHRSSESLKAAELYLKGLEIELEKPVEGKRGRRVREDYVSSSEEERAEGKFWTLQSTLDLIVGLTDAHRFGVLQPPSSQYEASTSPNGFTSKDHLDSLWTRSSRVSSRVLSHPTISPLVTSLPTLLSGSTATPASSLSRSTSTSSSRRPQSVSRSYSHPAAQIPEPGGGPQSRKLQLTIAIHALYILALQAFSSSDSDDTPSTTALELPLTPDASPILIDGATISTSPSKPNDLPASTEERGKQLSSTLFSLILQLANPAVNGPIGIKEGDELVNRAQRRLASIRNEDIPGEEDWRLAKKKKKTNSVEAAEGLSIPPSGHGKERSNDTTSSSMTITPNLLDQRRNSKFHFAEEDEEPEQSTAYPSPPVTPPPADHASSSNKQLPQLDTSVPPPPVESLRSPPLASPLQPRYHALHSQSTTHLTSHDHRQRADSLSSFVSTSPSPSLLSSRRQQFDPSRKLLRRVESSTSVCTVPPDFGATRLKAGDKGKGKAVNLNESSFDGITFVRGETTFSHQRRGGRLEKVEIEDRKVGKSWLSRFFSVSGLNPVRENGGGARDRLKEALKRDEEAVSNNVEYIMDWGDEDEPTEDEEEEESARQAQESSPSPISEPEPQFVKLSKTANNDATIKASRPRKDNSRPNLPRRQSSKTSLHSKRSFMLNDPTTSSASSDNLLSPTAPSQSHRRNGRHRRHPSSSSSSNFLSPLSAANPLPPTSPKNRAVSIDPLLLELEKRSRVGVRTVCQNCHKKGLNYPACRSCGKSFCGRECRIGEGHKCVQ